MTVLCQNPFASLTVEEGGEDVSVNAQKYLEIAEESLKRKKKKLSKFGGRWRKLTKWVKKMFWHVVLVFWKYLTEIIESIFVVTDVMDGTNCCVMCRKTSKRIRDLESRLLTVESRNIKVDSSTVSGVSSVSGINLNVPICGPPILNSSKVNCGPPPSVFVGPPVSVSGPPASVFGPPIAVFNTSLPVCEIHPSVLAPMLKVPTAPRVAAPALVFSAEDLKSVKLRRQSESDVDAAPRYTKRTTGVPTVGDIRAAHSALRSVKFADENQNSLNRVQERSSGIFSLKEITNMKSTLRKSCELKRSPGGTPFKPKDSHPKCSPQTNLLKSALLNKFKVCRCYLFN